VPPFRGRGKVRVMAFGCAGGRFKKSDSAENVRHFPPSKRKNEDELAPRSTMQVKSENSSNFYNLNYSTALNFMKQNQFKNKLHLKQLVTIIHSSDSIH
jgi:hypothetical protein